MDQKLKIKPEEVTQVLINVLVKHSLVDSSIIEELIKKRDNAVTQARKQIQGTCYLIDYFEKRLKIFDTYTGEFLSSVPLPGNPSEFRLDDFESWGTDSVIINTFELQKEGEIPYEKKASYGIVIREGYSYLYNPWLDNQSLLGLTRQYICGAIPKKTKTGIPFDMYFSEDYSLLCLSNRDEGKIYLFDVASSTFTDEINVRNQGSHKAINLGISMMNRKIYITDNTSQNLYIYDLDSKTLTKKNLYLGILGNLCLSPDEQSLYMIIIKPEQNLKNISIKNFSEIKSFPPKGELFSIGDAPCDLITLSPDKKYIFSMTFINDPNPFTPVISVIDTEKNKPVKRFSIKDGSNPVNLCFEDINPLGPVNKTLEDMLIENKLFSINKLRDIKTAIMNGVEDPLAELEKEEFIEIEGEELEFELRHDRAVHGAYESVAPRKINHIKLPERANKHIKECLVNSFWMKHEIDLREIPEIQQNLDKIVEKVRLKLEDYDLEIVEIKGFYDKKLALEGIILREFILEMLDEEDSEDRQKIKTVPTNCPNCGALLLGSWDCATCGFELERPEDALRRKIASVNPLVNLAKGNILIVDPKHGELFELDSFKVPVWKTSKYHLGLKSVTTAIRLENMNTMILDGTSGEIVEVTPKGKIARRMKLTGAEFPLNHPAFFTVVNFDHLLIADTGNHRVMETDMDGHIIWEYGKAGMAGVKPGYLNHPSYIQKTYDGTYLITDTGNDRIIEVAREMNTRTGFYEMKTVWEYGSGIDISEGTFSELNGPGMALKELSGNILILDNGNKRLIEVTPEKEIHWEYKTETDDEASSISFPERFTRLKNKDILLVGDGKYVQIMPSAKNRLIWTITRKELSLRTGITTMQENITKVRVTYGGSPQFLARLPKYGLRTEEDLQRELQEIIARKMAEATIPPPRWEDSEKPFSILTPGQRILPMPVLLLDKVNNKVMLADRQAKVFWSYGDNKVEKLVRVKMADITPDKTVLITNAKGLMEVFHEKLRDYYFQAENETGIRKDEQLVSDVSERVWVYPCHAESAVRLKNGNTLISDSKKFRVIEINRDEQIVWEHYHITRDALAAYATRLDNGNTLITYSSAHIVVEVDPDHQIVWSFGENNLSFHDNRHLCYPEYACRLENGNTLIADTKNGRILEVDSSQKIVWAYKGTKLMRLISPNYVKRLKDYHTFIVHGGNRELLEIDMNGEVVWKMLLPLKQ